MQHRVSYCDLARLVTTIVLLKFSADNLQIMIVNIQENKNIFIDREIIL